MANETLAALEAAVARAVTVDASAKLLIDGIAARFETALAEAIANGASEADLAPVAEQVAALTASSDTLAASVAANTPAA